jgi:hypothetical protein
MGASRSPQRRSRDRDDAAPAGRHERRDGRSRSRSRVRRSSPEVAHSERPHAAKLPAASREAAAPVTPPAAPSAAVAPPPVTLRFHYRGPADGQVVGPYRLSVFAAWAAAGALSPDAVATLRVWPEGGAETESKPLVPLLAALALQR